MCTFKGYGYIVYITPNMEYMHSRNYRYYFIDVRLSTYNRYLLDLRPEVSDKPNIL